MVNVCGAEVSCPPLAVPPSSCSQTVTVAAPLALGAGRYVNMPVPASMAGGRANRAGLSVVVRKVSVWPASPAGPAEIAVAQPGTVCIPASS